MLEQASGSAFVFDRHFYVMKEIQLTHGKVTQVDNEDYNYLNRWAWRAMLNKTANKWYAVRTGEGIHKITGKIVPKIVGMHRIILELTDGKVYGDHKDGDSLNNQRFNLRPSTPSQNAMNKKPRKDSHSKYHGVTYRLTKPIYKRVDGTIKAPYYIYIVRIFVNNKRKFVAQFPATPENEILAAKAYDTAAKLYYGEFANLNFKEA